MVAQVGVGFSTLNNPEEAGTQAVNQALEALSGSKADLLLLFSTSNLEPQQVLAAVRAAAGAVPLAGACSAGIIVGTQGITRGVAVMAIASDDIEFTLGAVSHTSQNPQAKARALLQQLQANANGAASAANSLVMLGIDNCIPADAFVSAVQTLGDGLGTHSQIVGASTRSSDDRLGFSTFLNDTINEDGMVGLRMRTHRPIGVGFRHGYKPRSESLVVTKASGHVVYELDGKPAFDKYMEQFPVKNIKPETFGQFAIDYPFGMPQGDGEYIIRDPFDAQPDGAVLCGSTVPEQATVNIMIGNRGTLIQSAKEAADDARRQLKGNRPLFALVFSCVTRLAYLGVGVGMELQMVRQAVGANVPMIGLFSFGEIAGSLDKPVAMHNKTVVVGLVGEV